MKVPNIQLLLVQSASNPSRNGYPIFLLFSILAQKLECHLYKTLERCTTIVKVSVTTRTRLESRYGPHLNHKKNYKLRIPENNKFGMMITHIVLKSEKYKIIVTMTKGKLRAYQLLYLLILRVTNARTGVVVNPRGKKKKSCFMNFAKVRPVYKY